MASFCWKRSRDSIYLLLNFEFWLQRKDLTNFFANLSNPIKFTFLIVSTSIEIINFIAFMQLGL